MHLCIYPALHGEPLREKNRHGRFDGDQLIKPVGASGKRRSLDPCGHGLRPPLGIRSPEAIDIHWYLTNESGELWNLRQTLRQAHAYWVNTLTKNDLMAQIAWALPYTAEKSMLWALRMNIACICRNVIARVAESRPVRVIIMPKVPTRPS